MRPTHQLLLLGGNVLGRKAPPLDQQLGQLLHVLTPIVASQQVRLVRLQRGHAGLQLQGPHVGLKLGTGRGGREEAVFEYTSHAKPGFATATLKPGGIDCESTHFLTGVIDLCLS